MNVQAGGQVSNGEGDIGNFSGSTGSATVTGSGSTWTNNGPLYVGSYGSGKLTVADGGLVTARSLYASLSDLSGNGTITVTKGAVLDADLTFDGTHGLTQAMTFGAGGTLNLTVDPSDMLGAGFKGTGTLRIAAGVAVASYYGNIGYLSGATGMATVSGAGSKWTISSSLSVGNNGSGKLTVTDGGQVTAGMLLASLSDLSGNGAITATQGAVLDADLVFDATHGVTQVIPFGTGGTLSMTAAGGTLGAGYKSTGTLLIGGGVTVASSTGYLGYKSGSTGTGTVTGVGSKWTNSGNLYVGLSGSGALNVQAGGLVSNSTGYLGSASGAAGTATVTGAGSTWTNSSILDVGISGIGKLTVADGGKVTATSVIVNNTQSTIRLNVSGNDMLVLGNSTTTGSVTNKGTVSFCANAFLTKGTYTPISELSGRAMTWSGTGSYKAVGGVWDSTGHTFTVVDPTTATAGVLTGVSTGQRLVITDTGSNKHVGASFGSVTGGANFSAALMNDSELAALSQTTGFAGSVLSGWDFNTNLTGTEVMLAFDIGTGAGDLAVWHYTGGAWTLFTSDMQTYDANGILSFTATDFAGGYAVTATPEPATLAMLTIGALAMLRRRRTHQTQTTR